MEKIEFNDKISETLLINLYMRNLDSKREKPLLADKFSSEVVAKIDYDFAKFNASKMTAAGAVVRAKFFDEQIIKFYEKFAGNLGDSSVEFGAENSLENSANSDAKNEKNAANSDTKNSANSQNLDENSSEKNSTQNSVENATNSDAKNSANSDENVVNSHANSDEISRAKIIIVQVGAGLDTRPLRLQNICKNAVFYDLDLPDVIALREKIIPKAAQNFSIPSSMFETAWMDELASKHRGAHFCFVLEGVAMYFDMARLGAFFRELTARFKGAFMMDVLGSSTMFVMKKKRHDALRFMKNEFKFNAIDDVGEIERACGAKCVKQELMFALYRWYWPFLGRIMGLIPPFKNFSSYLVFKM